MSTDAGVVPDGGTPPVLELREVTVRFGSVPALSRVSLALRAGEVTCVLGENGSGKSTLVAVLSGLQRPAEGELRVDGQPVRFRSPQEARAAGIRKPWAPKSSACRRASSAFALACSAAASLLRISEVLSPRGASRWITSIARAGAFSAR